MNRLKNTWPRGAVVLVFAIVNCGTLCRAGPLGPLPNVTSSELGLKEGSCALGDVVYMPGDEFPGSTPCEKCHCNEGGVQCMKKKCEPRPGCKALHRPDQCCPTYQCECEQEGRVYGNGEKLVDPADPCRVCYCQGGEVVCRRIACFVRDDCQPRLVPGRCCPEYDNCPLRGVTTIPGGIPFASVDKNTEDIGTSSTPTIVKENIKQEITIKEITPVSEIPVMTNVKVKEILPSPNIEISEYTSSKSPLIPREVTTEKNEEIGISVTAKLNISISTERNAPSFSIGELSSEGVFDFKSTSDTFPAKITFSTQDSKIGEIYSSVLPSATFVSTPAPSDVSAIVQAPSTKAPLMEEEDPALFEHNPAFPPLPDDLSVVSHDEEITPEQNLDNAQVPAVHELVTSSSMHSSTPILITKEHLLTTTHEFPITTTPVTDIETTEDSINRFKTATTIEGKIVKESSMINLKSAIPSEILNIPSSIPEDITGELDDEGEASSTGDGIDISTTVNPVSQIKELTTKKTVFNNIIMPTTESTPTITEIETAQFLNTTQKTLSSTLKSDATIDVTFQAEFSSLPIETSDQNPHEVNENISNDKFSTSTDNNMEEKSNPKSLATELEVGSDFNMASNGVTDTDAIEFSTEGSAESTTDAVEIINSTLNSEKNGALIDQFDKKNNVLIDLRNLVGDVASFGDHSEGATNVLSITSSPSISDSEELILVNSGYKSKNKNWNHNSITESPFKGKGQVPINKQKIMEIEDDSEHITDSPAPNDKIEPTTRRPIIDNVSDDVPQNKTEKKDIEIITKSYVPTINRRPTKIVTKKGDKITSIENLTEDNSSFVSFETTGVPMFEATSEEIIDSATVLNGKMEIKRKGMMSELSTPTQ